jgi:hypothetical protein
MPGKYSARTRIACNLFTAVELVAQFFLLFK